MSKRNTNTQLLFKLSQLEQLLRGTDFKSFKYLEDTLKLSKRTIQRRLGELNNPEGKVQERYHPINKKDKEFRIFDPAYNSMPMFNQNEIYEIWNKVLYKNQLNMEQDLLVKFLKIITMRTSDTGPYKDKIDKVEKAIKNNRKIEMDYISRKKNESKRLLVTPAYIDYNTNKLFVYYKNENTLFKYFFESMSNVKISTETADDFSKWIPQNEEEDIFGFSMKDKSIMVEIEMETFAKNQLIGQFGKSAQYITPSITRPNYYFLKMPVADIAPIGRFIFGIISQINILGDKHFRSELNEYYKTYVELGLNEIQKKWN